MKKIKNNNNNLLLYFIPIAVVVILLFSKFINLIQNERFFIEPDPIMNDYIAKIKNILLNISDGILTDIDIRAGSESATFEKKTIYLCLKDPNTGEFYNFQILLYVAIHELAHLMSTSFSSTVHNDEFKQNFNILLKKAVQRGFLHGDVKIPLNYCKPH